MAIVPRAEHLVIGMRGYDHDAGPGQRIRDWQVPQFEPCVPGILGGAWPVNAVRRERPYHVVPPPATSAPSSARSRSAWCCRTSAYADGECQSVNVASIVSRRAGL